MPEIEESTFVVIRFQPFGKEALSNSIDRQADGDRIKGRTVRYGVSVFGDVVGPDESIDEAIDRICTVASKRAGGDKIAVVTQELLSEKQYRLFSAPPEMHYLVGGEDLGVRPDVTDLAELFTNDRRPNPAFDRSGSG